MDAIHISQALAMLDSGKPVDLSVVKKDGTIFHPKEVVGLRYDHYKGTRQIKCIRSGEIRTIHDVCIIRINDFDVYL